MSTKKEVLAVVAGMRLMKEVDDLSWTSPTTVAEDIFKISNYIASEDDATVIANLQILHLARTAGDVEARDDENEGVNGDIESVDTMDLTEAGTFDVEVIEEHPIKAPLSPTSVLELETAEELSINFMCPQRQSSNIFVDNSSMERGNIADAPHVIRQPSFMNKNEIVETLTKDKPPRAQSQPAEISKVGEATKVSKWDAAKYSPSKENVAKRKPDLGWRAAKDPNSGLIYYYHAETRETTWEKPPGFVPSQAPAKGTPRSARRPATKNQDKPEVVGARGIMGFLSKMKKTKPEVETNVRAQKSPANIDAQTRLPIESPNNSSMERENENNDPEEMNSIIQNIIEDFTPQGDQKILRAIGRTATVNAAILITAATGGAAGAIGYVTGGAITAKRLSDGIIQKDEKEVTKSLAVYGCATGASIAGQAITGAVMIGIVGASLPLAGVVAFGVGCCSGVTAGALSEWTVDNVMDRFKGKRNGNDTLERSESEGALLNSCNESSQDGDKLARSQSCRF